MPAVSVPGLGLDWPAVCARAADRVAGALEAYPAIADRAAPAGRGEGGDLALVIDRVAEDAILAELDALGVGLTVVSEERGRLELGGGGPVHVVVDPLDGSRNAKRGLAPYAVSIAVASGPRLGDVEYAFVADLHSGERFTARAGGGAWLDGRPLAALADGGSLEMVGLEFIRPGLVAEHSAAVAATGAERLRAVGSIALSLCYVAAGRLDAMVALAECRSVDIAAGHLILLEVGGAVAYPDEPAAVPEASLELSWRSRALAASGETALARLQPLA